MILIAESGNLMSILLARSATPGDRLSKSLLLLYEKDIPKRIAKSNINSIAKGTSQRVIAFFWAFVVGVARSLLGNIERVNASFMSLTHEKL